MKPDTSTAMRQLIGEIRAVVPFEQPDAALCRADCRGCSVKLMAYLEDEVLNWETRLDDGDKPGLRDLSQLAKSARKVHAVLVRNGVISSLQPGGEQPPGQ